MSNVTGITGIVATFCLYMNSVCAEEYNINPGMWETTYKQETTGMPPEMAAMMNQQPSVERECVKDKNYDFNSGEDMKGCKVKVTRHGNSKASYDISCDAEHGSSHGHGEINFNGDKISGKFEMNMQQGPGGPMTIKNSFSGKRVGSC